MTVEQDAVFTTKPDLQQTVIIFQVMLQQMKQVFGCLRNLLEHLLDRLCCMANLRYSRMPDFGALRKSNMFMTSNSTLMVARWLYLVEKQRLYVI